MVMKKLITVPGVLAALLFLSVAAQATTTDTIHGRGVTIDLGSAGCVPGELFATGNAVMHLTVNNALDSWLTETVEGAATVIDASGATLFTGHVAAWFGLEDNKQNAVGHFTANANGTLTDGTSVRIHQEGQFTYNANGVPVVQRVTITCG
jgi:hypothetical protein